jgi:hypothetical protein
MVHICGNGFFSMKAGDLHFAIVELPVSGWTSKVLWLVDVCLSPWRKCMTMLQILERATIDFPAGYESVLSVGSVAQPLLRCESLPKHFNCCLMHPPAIERSNGQLLIHRWLDFLASHLWLPEDIAFLCISWFIYPPVNVYKKKTLERSTIFNEKTHYKWSFSIAM